jgi:CubicO group peptidase (beta-lactamase class C family)
MVEVVALRRLGPRSAGRPGVRLDGARLLAAREVPPQSRLVAARRVPPWSRHGFHLTLDGEEHFGQTYPHMHSHRHLRNALRLLLTLFTLTQARAADFSRIAAGLEPAVQEEMREWEIGGIAVALVDNQRVVYAHGFGEAKRDSIFRVGSISKLFNAVAVMQQVEAGKLNLDAPLPADVTPINPFPDQPAVTLRQLLCHRSGLQREPNVGGYLDGTEPGLAATIGSVPAGVLVTRPTEKTRYSNLGPSIAGFLVERASGESFEAYQRAHVLGPLGMTNSAWTLNRDVRKKLVVSHIRVADGRGGFKRQETPVFDLGTIPAGNLFSTAEDLARFASSLIAGGRGVLKRDTLDQMWKPQFTTAKSGFGLAFMIGSFRDYLSVSHSGAVYGHSTSLVVLPEAEIAVIVLANEDIANGRVHRISNEALALMLDAKFGVKPVDERPRRVAMQQLDPFAGDYESQSYWAELRVKDGKLVGNVSGQLTKFTATDELKFVADSRLEDATPVAFTRGTSGAIDGFSLGAQKFERVKPAPAPLPKHWRAFLGNYGPKIIPIIISERHGHLYAMTENMVDYRLTPMNRNVCKLPPGMYVDEEVVFLTDKSGRPHSMNFANMILPRH